jgi:hypothetical protein
VKIARALQLYPHVEFTLVNAFAGTTVSAVFYRPSIGALHLPTPRGLVGAPPVPVVVGAASPVFVTKRRDGDKLVLLMSVVVDRIRAARVAE